MSHGFLNLIFGGKKSEDNTWVYMRLFNVWHASKFKKQFDSCSQYF